MKETFPGLNFERMETGRALAMELETLNLKLPKSPFFKDDHSYKHLTSKGINIYLLGLFNNNVRRVSIFEGPTVRATGR